MEIRQLLFTVAGPHFWEMTLKPNPKQPATISRRKTQRGVFFQKTQPGQSSCKRKQLSPQKRRKGGHVILAQGKLQELRKGSADFSVVLVEMLDF